MAYIACTRRVVAAVRKYAKGSKDYKGKYLNDCRYYYVSNNGAQHSVARKQLPNCHTRIDHDDASYTAGQYK